MGISVAEQITKLWKETLTIRWGHVERKNPDKYKKALEMFEKASLENKLLALNKLRFLMAKSYKRQHAYDSQLYGNYFEHKMVNIYGKFSLAEKIALYLERIKEFPSIPSYSFNQTGCWRIIERLDSGYNVTERYLNDDRETRYYTCRIPGKRGNPGQFFKGRYVDAIAYAVELPKFCIFEATQKSRRHNTGFIILLPKSNFIKLKHVPKRVERAVSSIKVRH